MSHDYILYIHLFAFRENGISGGTPLNKSERARGNAVVYFLATTLTRSTTRVKTLSEKAALQA